MAWKTTTASVLKDPAPALKRLLTGMQQNPLKTTVGGGALVAAGDSMSKAQEQESEFMKNRLGAPGGKFVYAEEKTAAFLEEAFVKEAVGDGSWNSAWASGVEGIGSGVGQSIGGAGVSLLTDILRKAGRGLSQKLVYDAKRRDMLRTVLTTDPMLSAFEKQNPGLLLKVYASMVSVAPTLSLDRNAVTTFMREAAQTHGALNYMTIKQLAETEKAINESTGRDLSRLRR